MNHSTVIARICLIILLASTSVSCFVPTSPFVGTSRHRSGEVRDLFYKGATTLVEPPVTATVERMVKDGLFNRQRRRHQDTVAGIIGLNDSTIRHKVRRGARKIKRKPNELKMIARSTAVKAFRQGQDCAKKALQEILKEYGIEDKGLVL